MRRGSKDGGRKALLFICLFFSFFSTELFNRQCLTSVVYIPRLPIKRTANNVPFFNTYEKTFDIKPHKKCAKELWKSFSYTSYEKIICLIH